MSLSWCANEFGYHRRWKRSGAGANMWWWPKKIGPQAMTIYGGMHNAAFFGGDTLRHQHMRSNANSCTCVELAYDLQS